MEMGNFKDWLIERQIGEGRFGKVWLIRRIDPFGGEEELAALKVVRITPSAEEIAACPAQGMTLEDLEEIYQQKLRKAIREIDIMRNLQGESSIVNYQDYELIPLEGEIGWELRIRMELLTTLRTYVQKQGLSLETVADVGKSITTALSLCHHSNKSMPIVHGDVKPGNIYYSRPHCFKLGDFGLSFLMGGCDITDAGTHTYLAPECLRGEPLSEKSDQYALGVVLRELLALGKWDLSDSPVAQQYAQLETIIQRATMENPNERFDNVEAMHAALEDLGDLNPVNARFNEQVPLGMQGSRTKTDIRQKEAVDGNHLSGMDAEPAKAQHQEEATEVEWEPSVAETYLKKEEQKHTQEKNRMHQRMMRIGIIVVTVLIIVFGVILVLPKSKGGGSVGVVSIIQQKSKPELLNEYMKKPGASVAIEDVCACFDAGDNNSAYAVAFDMYADVLFMLEKGEYEAALRDATDLLYNASFANFRAYLEDGKELQEQGLYAIGTIENLLNYVNARKQESEGNDKQAALLYDRCRQFMDANDRRKALGN